MNKVGVSSHGGGRLTESARSVSVVVAAAKNVITSFTTDAAKPSTIQQTLNTEVNFSLSTHFCKYW
jgi:hypothetical protein